MAAAKSLFAVVAVVVIAGCNGPTSPDAVPLGTPFDLAAGATAELTDGFVIKFVRVGADSRCPLDAQCVRAGEAAIMVGLVAPNDQHDTLELRTDAPLVFANHRIQLLALEPYPRAGQQTNPRDHVATFVVQRR